MDVLGLTCQQLEQAAALALTAGAGAASRIYRHAIATGRLGAEVYCKNAATVDGWNQAFTVGLLTVVRTVEEPGNVGTTAKAVLATADGYEVEVVRIPMKAALDGTVSAWTLCLSSQVGCKMGCTFCETGRMGLIRHLSAAEIVAQVLTVRIALGWTVSNLVFMGMGEALDNADQVIQAITVLTGKPGFQYALDKITVCTSGHAEGLTKLAATGWKRLNLSVSLNSGDEAVRSRIMPVNRRTSLAELQRILMSIPRRPNFTFGVNYCLLPGINDGPDDAERVAEFCRPLGRVLVNLIPYNPGNAPLTRAPEESEIGDFIDRLRATGLPVRRRITKGRSIMAACGQLGNVALRRQRPAPAL